MIKFLVIAILHLVGSLSALRVSSHEAADSVVVSTLAAEASEEVAERKIYRVRAKQFIAPALLIGAGVCGVCIGGVRDVNRNIRSRVGLNHRQLRCDDYLQYSPVAAMWTLDVCGVKSQHGFAEQTTILAVSALCMTAMVNTVKYTVRERRPTGARNSFPSGHTATAFMGAELLRLEYRDTSPWIGAAGYCAAALTGAMRIYNDRHWTTDVLAGAGIGIVSAKIGYWLAPCTNRIWQRRRPRTVERSVQTAFCAVPQISTDSYGVAIGVTF